MPVAPFEERLDLDAFFALDVPVAYVRPTRGDPAASAAFAERQGWPVGEIDAGHLPMVAKPEPVAEWLDNFVRQPAARLTRIRPAHDISP